MTSATVCRLVVVINVKRKQHVILPSGSWNKLICKELQKRKIIFFEGHIFVEVSDLRVIWKAKEEFQYLEDVEWKEVVGVLLMVKQVSLKILSFFPDNLSFT